MSSMHQKIVIALLVFFSVDNLIAQEIHNSLPMESCEVVKDDPARKINGILTPGVKNRIISRTGKKYYLATQYGSIGDKIKIEEKPRSKRISSDFDLLKTVYADFTDTPIFTTDSSEISAPKEDFVKNNPGCYILTFEPALDRANVKLTFSSGDYYLITGPQEHWYLTADVIVTNIKGLSKSKDGSVSTKDDPKSFYVGFNWRVGDVLTDYSRENRSYPDLIKNSIPFLNRVAGKFMLSVANRPQDSMGLGVSYAAENFEVFLARIKNRKENNDSTLRVSYSTQIGLSFPLDKAIDWIAGVKP